MPETSDTRPARATTTKKEQGAAVRYFLVLYNAISAILWSAILGRVLLIALLYGPHRVYVGTGAFAKWTQTLAGLEVVFAATGLVRAPLFTTAMQVASRYFLVWGIVNNFPHTTSVSPVYSTMLTAWSFTEVVRYSFFAINLFFGDVPNFLLWLRYNTFFVLYPAGIASECWLVYLAIDPAEKLNLAYGYVLKLVLFIYIPGSYILFTHMMAQRRKIMKGKGPAKTQ